MSGDRSRYVQAFQRQVAVPEGSRDRNLAAIERRLAAGEVVDEDEEDDQRRAPRGRWAAALVMFKAVSLSVGLGVAGLGVVKVGAMTWQSVAKDDAQVQPAVPEEPAREEKTKPERRAAAVPAVTKPGEPVPRAERAVVPAVERAAVKPAKGVKAPVADRLREELDILERARVELEAGRHAAVLDLVAEHERRFPDGAMLEERRAWQAIARCSLHRADARGHAESFLARHPRSSLAEKVRRACADQLTDPKVRAD